MPKQYSDTRDSYDLITTDKRSPRSSKKVKKTAPTFGVPSYSSSGDNYRRGTRNTCGENKNERVALLKNKEGHGTNSGSKRLKFKNLTIRIWWSVIMLFAGAVVFSNGFMLYSAMMTIIYFVYKEYTSLKIVILPEKESIVQKILQWYLFLVVMIYGVGDILISHLWPERRAATLLTFFLLHRKMFLFSSYCLNLIIFVLSLRKSYYRQQFLMFAWMSTGLLLVWCETYAVSKTIKSGPAWVLLPIFLVIINDSSAYFTGQLLGSTPLIKVSPKKTWEGFIGGFIATLICSLFVSRKLTQYPYMYCPDWSLTRSVFSKVVCEKASAYIDRSFSLPQFISESFLADKLRDANIIDLSSIVASPFQFHSLFIAFFVSLVAPFAGFLASGLKRGLKMKDFSNTIPGHGGVIDRVDCHLITLMFVFVYHQSFVRVAKQSDVNLIARYAIRKLSNKQINQLINILTDYVQLNYI